MAGEKRPGASGSSTPPSDPGSWTPLPSLPGDPTRQQLPFEPPRFPSLSQFANAGLDSQFAAISESLALCQGYSANLFGLEHHDYPRNVNHDDEKRRTNDKTVYVPPIHKALTEARIRTKIWETECGLREVDTNKTSWLEVLDETSNHGLRRLMSGTFLNLQKTAEDTFDSLAANSGPLRQQSTTAELQVLGACHQLDIGVTRLAELQPLVQMFRAEMAEGAPEGPLGRLKRHLVSMQCDGQPSVMLRRDKRDNPPLNETHPFPRSIVWQIWKDTQNIGRSLPLFLRPLRQTGLLTAVLSDGQNLSFNVLRRTSLHVLLMIIHLLGITLVPLLLLYPLWLDLLILFGLAAAHKGLCRLLNGDSDSFVYSHATKSEGTHAHEAWIFLPRVGTSTYELEHQLDHVSTVFGRPIAAFPTRTHGLFPDLIRELFLRNTAYQTPLTQELRKAFNHVRQEIVDPARSKVVILAYSSGGIYASIIVRMLLQQGLQHFLQKLEIYTFGGSFCEFMNPSNNQPPVQDNAEGLGLSRSAVSKGDAAVSQRSLAHIEHFAKADDPLALIGVLDRSNWPTISGDIFELPVDGVDYKHQPCHLFKKGYLDCLFPINGQMSSAYTSMAELQVITTSANDPQESAQGRDQKGLRLEAENQKSLKASSRLYQYMNGREPTTVDADWNRCFTTT
ncbi:hypothetical protein QBC40DRAFT_277144 [Triangularia verruculosa]|uniref:Uncharacterized protein n=1 Tax=Triangularia verruculosa TaxID=2587418 RepID=A0AAN6XK69_9PEZI|nr:hypothetical protein QBC40DRAFT_277144 [Triangularia verruculosa]